MLTLLFPTYRNTMLSFQILDWLRMVQQVIRAMSLLGSWGPMDMLLLSILQQVYLGVWILLWGYSRKHDKILLFVRCLLDRFEWAYNYGCCYMCACLSVLWGNNTHPLKMRWGNVLNASSAKRTNNFCKAVQYHLSHSSEWGNRTLNREI